MHTLCLQYAATGKCEELKESLTRYVFRQAFADYLTIRKQDSFAYAVGECRKQVFPQAQETARLLTPTLALYHELRKQLKGKVQPAWLEALNDISDQLSHLVYVGFLDALSPEELRHFPRYLKGIQRRLQKLAENPTRDRHYGCRKTVLGSVERKGGEKMKACGNTAGCWRNSGFRCSHRNWEPRGRYRQAAG